MSSSSSSSSSGFSAKIEFVITADSSLCASESLSQPLAVSLSLSAEEVSLLTLHSLKQFVRDKCTIWPLLHNSEEEHTLCISWRGIEGEMPILSDEDLRIVIERGRATERASPLQLAVSLEGERNKRRRLSAQAIPLEHDETLAFVRRYCAEAVHGYADVVSPLCLAVEAGDAQGVRALLTCSEEMVLNEGKAVQWFIELSIEDRVNLPAEEGVRMC